MSKRVWMLTLLAAVTLMGADFGENLYTNSNYELAKTRKGEIRVRDHWHTGDLQKNGTYKDHPVVSVTAQKTSWGKYNAVFATNDLKLAPGKYCYSVWCKLEQKDLDNMIFWELIKRSNVNGKQVNAVKKYDKTRLPKADTWTELVEIFEITPQDTKVKLLSRHYAKGPAKVSYACPRLVKYKE